MSPLSIILIASLTPVLVLLLYIYKKDKYQKEPFGLLMKAFFGGILSGITTIVVLTLLSPLQITHFNSPLQDALYNAFCMAALPEELFKLLFLYWFIWKSEAFDEYYDGIEYAAFVGLGFAGLENIIYVMQGGLGVAVSRAIFAVPAHFFFAIIMGYFFSFARFRPWKKNFYLLLAYICPVLMHGIYDFILMYNDALSETSTGIIAILNIAFYIFFIFIWKIAKKRIDALSGR